MALTHKEIKNGQLVFDQEEKKCYQIRDVRKITRGIDDEKAYSLFNIVNNTIEKNVCEHSHTTSVSLIAITKEVAILHLRYNEGDLLMEFGKIQKDLKKIQLALSNLETNTENND